MGQAFIQDGMGVPTHGSSRVVSTLLLKVTRAGKHLENSIRRMALSRRHQSCQTFVEKEIPTSVILDSAFGYVMQHVDIVEGVMNHLCVLYFIL